MNHELIPDSELRRRDGAIRRIVSESAGKFATELDGSAEADAFARYLLFSDSSLYKQVELGPLSETRIFYNRYYWFLTFAKLRRSKRGHDAGVEQQAFKLLESAPDAVDWGVVAEIANDVSASEKHD